MSKICWLGLRTENDSEPLSEWLEFGDEEEYNWYWVMCSLKGGTSAIVSEQHRHILEERLELLIKEYPNDVYQIFEEMVHV